MGFVQDFKKFALRGNVIDMAVGIIIGAAFTSVVKSLVDDILMPPLGMLVSNVNFTRLAIELKPAVGETPAVAIHYGNFINNIISFTIVALTVFIIIRVLNNAEKAMEARSGKVPPLPGEPTDKKCPYCLSTVPVKATRCAFCTSELEAPGSAS